MPQSSEPVVPVSRRAMAGATGFRKKGRRFWNRFVLSTLDHSASAAQDAQPATYGEFRSPAGPALTLRASPRPHNHTVGFLCQRSAIEVAADFPASVARVTEQQCHFFLVNPTRIILTPLNQFDGSVGGDALHFGDRVLERRPVETPCVERRSMRPVRGSVLSTSRIRRSCCSPIQCSPGNAPSNTSMPPGIRHSRQHLRQRIWLSCVKLCVKALNGIITIA